MFGLCILILVILLLESTIYLFLDGIKCTKISLNIERLNMSYIKKLVMYLPYYLLQILEHLVLTVCCTLLLLLFKL